MNGEVRMNDMEPALLMNEIDAIISSVPTTQEIIIMTRYGNGVDEILRRILQIKTDLEELKNKIAN